RCRARGETPVRLLLQPDDRHVGRAGRRLCGGGGAGDRGWRRRPRGRARNGGAARLRALRSSWQAILALAFSLVAATVPVMGEAIYPAQWTIVALLAVTAIASVAIRPVAWRGLLLFLGSSLAAWLLIAMLAGNEGAARPGYFLLVAAAWLLAWAGV